MQPLISFMGIGYLGGGLLFAIALFRAQVLPRWTAVLLAVGAVAPIVDPRAAAHQLQTVRLAQRCRRRVLGFSLWREQRTRTARPVTSPVSAQPDARLDQADADDHPRAQPALLGRPVLPGVDSPTRSAKSTGRWVPFALVVLVVLPAFFGYLRLVELAGGPHVMPANPRLNASPLPVFVHIISAVGYSILGAFQFSAGLRRRRPGWHRAAGRVLVVLGLVVALSALWLTLFYPRQPGTGELAYVFRLAFGSGMAASIILGFTAIRRGDVARHRAWMTRAYALALGAATQIFTLGIGPRSSAPACSHTT